MESPPSRSASKLSSSRSYFQGFSRLVLQTFILLPLKARPPLRHNEQLKGGGEMGQHSDETIERWTAKQRAALVLKVLKRET